MIHNVIPPFTTFLVPHIVLLLLFLSLFFPPISLYTSLQGQIHTQLTFAHILFLYTLQAIMFLWLWLFKVFF